MTIAALAKVSLLGPAADKDSTLDGLQRLGCMHLEDLGPQGDSPPALETSDADARLALRWLRDSTVKRHSRGAPQDADVEAIVRETMEVRDRLRALTEEHGQLEKWIAAMTPWGDFELPEWAREGPLRLWFYELPLHRVAHLASIDLPWKIVAEDHRFAYVVVVAASEPVQMPVPATPLEPRPLSKLHGRLREVERELEQLEYRRIGLTVHIDLLQAKLDEADDRAARRAAARRVHDDEALFAVQGWVPTERLGDLRRFAEERGLASAAAAPSAGEEPPTLLENPPAWRGGEGLVTFYTTPAYDAWDPSKSVLLAFAVFFAIILADAGYGLVLGVILLALWKRLGTSSGGRSLRSLMLVVVACSVLYGVITASYFGIEVHEGSWPATLKLLDMNDQKTMMWLSIVIGAVHIAAANLVSAWRRRRSAAALGPLGWVAVVLGATAVGLAGSYPGLAAWREPGVAAVAAGAPLILLFTSRQPLAFAPRALLHRVLHGLEAIAHSTKAFGDVLSYLRLFALGLAAFKLAEVFNELAHSAFAVPGVGVLLGVLILLAGHGLNLAMGIMSGVVHSLRLNLIEFLSWSLPEEGRNFTPFATKARRETAGG
ncbi:MAG TPA: V-type ATP synthase subunit I [Gammaproteobacteria bacterium]|nr:V-type ATP synthase subunit I [Gammaproteobacteria bacterium]